MALNIRFHNTLTHQSETFTPLTAPVVKMYSCGPTVYDFAHIGNFRTFIFADVLRRFLELAGYEVQQVMNITDVGHMTEDDLADGGGEDKMELAAKRLTEDKKSGKVPQGAVENSNDPFQVAQYYTDTFLADAKALGMKVAFEYPQSMPHATQCIDIMQDMIAKLLENGHAYQTKDGVVYFSVESFPDYGKLSGNTLDKLRGGAGGRIDKKTIAGKKHPGDFLLWKPDEKHIMKWDSPWGTGYPGWHIECSCMAKSLLNADEIDIHTGGEDLTFPHHECEIAQSRGATGKDSFAKFWMHARFLLVDGQKMSKSKGSFYTARDVFEGKVTGRTVHPAVLRYELMRSHYRSNLNFTPSSLTDAASAVKRFTDFANQAKTACNDQPAEIDLNHPVLQAFTEALADDLNISGALGEVFAWINDCKDDPANRWAACLQIDRVLGLLDLKDQTTSDFDTDTLCKQLDEARANKDYATADDVRKQLIDAGYDVLTTKQGTQAIKKLA